MKPKVVRLENDYRSTEAILSVANELIGNSPARHEKTLRPTIKGGGEGFADVSSR